MKRWRVKLLAAGCVAALGLAIPAIGQESEEAPESLLPPGFGNPETLPPPAPQPATPPAPSVRAPGTPVPFTPPPPPPPAPVNEEELEALLAELDLPPPVEIPVESRRSVEVAGVLDASGGGLGADLYGNVNGRFLASLMRRMEAPLPSRWASILLRRALLTRAPAPSFIDPVDWTAERAWLLIRMGEADGARMLVQGVDVDRFTPNMFNVAVQSALATADPAGLCPLIGPGRDTSDEPVWALGDAMCAALAGESGRASSLIDQARRRGRVTGIDLALAQKVIGAGANTRRAVTLEWEPVDRLNSWRFGLAAATGVAPPERLMDGAGAHVRAWAARAPMIPVEQRLAAAHSAAALGVFSNRAMREVYSLIGDSLDVAEIGESDPGRLRQAHAAATAADRVAAMRLLWDVSSLEQRRGRWVLTAAAASAIPPDPRFAADAPNLVASMLSSGYDRSAARWFAMAEGMEGADADRLWAILALGSPGAPAVDAGRIQAFAEADRSAEKHRSKLLIAGLAGLGHIDATTRDSLAESVGVALVARNRWAAMLERAAASGQMGTVALLVAAGMQTGGWESVPASHLYAMTSALSRVGLEFEARMIAAEALSRL